MHCERKSKSSYMENQYYETGEIFTEIPFSSDSVINGTAKEYYKSGKLKKKINYIKGHKVDSSILYFKSGQPKVIEFFSTDTIYTNHFYKNGTKSIVGKFLRKGTPIEVGWFKLYDTIGTLTDSLEYINLDGNPYLNQRIHYQQGKKIEDSSFYFSFEMFSHDEKLNLSIRVSPKFKNSQIIMLINKNLKKDYSNWKDISYDSIFFDNNHISVEIEKKDVANKNYEFRGLFSEQLVNKKAISEDSITLTIKENKMFYLQSFKNNQ
jgi:hypothetical protein